MKNDNTVVYKNNTWSIYNNKSSAPGNKKKSRVEYLTLLGKRQLFDEAANENEGKQSEVTDMYIYTGKGVEKVSINTTTKEKKNETNKNKRYQYLKDKITNALKNQERIKQNTSENEFLNATENDPRDVFIFDKLKNEINIFNSKGVKEEEHKKGTDDAAADGHPLEESSFPHSDAHTTEGIFPGTDVHAEEAASVTFKDVGKNFGNVADGVGILPDQGEYRHEDEEPLDKKDESEPAIQSENRTNLDDEKKGTPNELQPAEEASTKPNGEFFIYTEKCSDISSETDDETYSDCSKPEVGAPKWESQPERGSFMPRLKNQTGGVKKGASFQRGEVAGKRKKGREGLYRSYREGGELPKGSLQKVPLPKGSLQKVPLQKGSLQKGPLQKGSLPKRSPPKGPLPKRSPPKGWHEKDPYEESWSEDSQGEYSPYKDPPRKHVTSAHRRDEFHSVQKEMHHLNVEINNVKDKMNIINNKKNGKINVLNKKINILKNKLSDSNANNLNDDINIVNSQIDLLFIKKINKMYKQIDSYVKNINDQIVKNLSSERTLDHLDSPLYSHIHRQISNIKTQVSNLHDQVNSHMYQQRSNKMFNQMNNQINNTSNQIGRHLGGQLHGQSGGRSAVDSRRTMPDEQCSYKGNHQGSHQRSYQRNCRRNSKGSLSEEEDLHLPQHEKKMNKRKGIAKQEGCLYRDNPFGKNAYHELHPQINFSSADEGSDADGGSGADGDAKYYGRVRRHHNGGAANVGEHPIEGDSFDSDASFTMCGTQGGKKIRGGSKGYNSSDSCRSRTSKRRKTRNDNEPNYDHLKRKKKLINPFSRNAKWEKDKCGDGTDKVEPQSGIHADGVRSRPAVETVEHTGLLSDDRPSGDQAVSCEKGGGITVDEGSAVQFFDASRKVGVVQAAEAIGGVEAIGGAEPIGAAEVIEVIDVADAAAVSDVTYVVDMAEVSGVTNVVDLAEAEEPADKGPDEEEVHHPFSDQKLMYLKKKLMQLDLFKRNQKRKNEEDGLNRRDVKTDASEQANEKEKRIAPMEVANGADKAIELVPHTEKGDALQNGSRSTYKTRRFMFVEEGQATEVGGSSGDAYGNYNAKRHWKRQASQNDKRRGSYPTGNVNSANESKDFVSMFQKLVRKEGENGRSDRKGQGEHREQNRVPHFYGNSGEDNKLSDESCLSEKSTSLRDGDQRKADRGGKNVDMLRHFFFLKDEMKGPEYVQETTSMNNTSNDQNGWRDPSSYPSASEAINENCANSKNTQLTNSFTIDQIYDYTVDYYHQMSESKEGGNDSNSFNNVSGVLNEENQMDC
ncbi:conserved Plasmodium protein, unknown function [Plasmodium vivax]|uniref:Uncharacterized protein n=1 Tax=Plasmodium vivax TaxID=5855 RepID=A0A1G4HJ85_PLAVI|nr:conserved Plasmodium protein, unknown function [Plasmodium vivax]